MSTCGVLGASTKLSRIRVIPCAVSYTQRVALVSDVVHM